MAKIVVLKRKKNISVATNNFGRKNKIHCFVVNSRSKVKEQAEKWSKLKIHKDDNEYVYTLVHSKLNGTGEPFGKSHRGLYEGV